MGLFDAIQDNAFNVVKNVFGDAATWSPSNGSLEQMAVVLYKDATEKHGLSDNDYNLERYQIEFAHNDFIGLKDAVARGDNEKVRIVKDGVILEFFVRRLETKFDGKTIVAFLNPPATL